MFYLVKSHRYLYRQVDCLNKFKKLFWKVLFIAKFQTYPNESKLNYNTKGLFLVQAQTTLKNFVHVLEIGLSLLKGDQIYSKLITSIMRIYKTSFLFLIIYDKSQSKFFSLYNINKSHFKYCYFCVTEKTCTCCVLSRH